MKLFVLGLGVLGLHLVVIGWFQVGQHADPSEVKLPAVQTRQIPAPTAIQPQASPVAQDRQTPVLAKTKLQVLRNHESTPTPAAVAPTPTLEVATKPPLTAAIGNDNGLATPSEKPVASANISDVASTGKAPSTVGVQLPSSNADYLKNPPPPYPALSLRLRETGKVVVQVLIGKNGQALDARVVHSSGFHRLDQSALKATLDWRYVPGKVDGQVRDMWFDIPISFTLPN